MAKVEQKRSWMWLVWVAGLAVLVAAVFWVRALTRETVRVRVARVTYQTLTSTVSTNGRVEPVGEFQAHAPGPGVVKKIYVNEGDRVAAGQLLVRMDDAEIRAHLATAQASLSQAELQRSQLQRGGTTEEIGQFRSNVDTARSQVKEAEASLRAVQALQQKGSASANEVASAQQRLDSANLNLKIAEGHTVGRYNSDERSNADARVADARATVAASQAALAAADIRSPDNGTVYSIPVSEYDYVHDGDDLMDVADLNRLQIRAYFDEPDIGRLGAGQPVRVVWDAKPSLEWHGHIEHVPTTIKQYGNRNIGECLITVDDAHGDLPPNSNVTVTVTEVKRAGVLSIPREALHTDGARNYVYRIVNGKLQQTPVQITSLVTNVAVEIAGGLKLNDSVVLGPATPGTELSNGLVVKPVR